MTRTNLSIHRLLLTNYLSKHTLALAKFTKQEDPSLRIFGNAADPASIGQRMWRRMAIRGVYDRIFETPLEKVLADHPFDLVIPSGIDAVFKTARSGARAMLPSVETIELASSKMATLEQANRVGVPCPTSQCSEGLDLEQVSFPCVVKAAREAGGTLVDYPRNASELRASISRIEAHPSQASTPPVVQNYLSGAGVGFFALYIEGELRQWYMHERIREMPVTGGASVCARTIFNERVFEFGKRLLDSLNWHGPAMVEFKLDHDGNPFLMEINPKLWGSLELGLRAGKNFGMSIVRHFRGEKVPVQREPDYRRMTLRWPLDGDLNHQFSKGRYLKLDRDGEANSSWYPPLLKTQRLAHVARVALREVRR